MLKKPIASFLGSKNLFILLALLYAGGASFSGWKVVESSQMSAWAFDQMLTRYSLQNEGERSLDLFSKHHPILGTFLSSPIQHNLKLSTHDDSVEALHADVTHLLKIVHQQSAVAAWWTCFLLSLSLLYAVTIIALSRSFTARAVLFSLTCISLVFFVLGVIAPAMVIWTAPSIPLESGQLNFVAQHEVRGIVAVITELFTSGHWIIGGFLLLFSVCTPLTKASLTIFVTASRSKDLNFRIGELLHTIGKWSMADVFVAGVLLALFALKFQEATKSVPCLGLYYFIGYCLLSMTTTELLVHSTVTAKEERKSEKKLGRGVLIGLFVILFCFVGGSIYYTYERYAVHLDENVKAPVLPKQLKEEDLPAHG